MKVLLDRLNHNKHTDSQDSLEVIFSREGGRLIINVVGEFDTVEVSYEKAIRALNAMRGEDE